MFIDKVTTKQLLRLTFSKKYFHPRRLAFQAFIAPIYTSVWMADLVGRWADEKFFPEFHDADIGEPIFIMASPRSGTTLLHRLMSLDPQFTSYSLWQTLLPTLTAYKSVEALTKLDDLAGNPLDKVQDLTAKYLFRGWEGIHETRFNHAEEDEGSFALNMATPSVWLAWPFVRELKHLAYIDELDYRERITEFFLGTMKRHMWHTQRKGEDKTLLLKNVFLAGRLGIVTDAAPNARFVNIVRHPYRTVASTMSLFTIPWRHHSPDIPLDGPDSRAFSDTAIEYARTVHRFMQELPPERGVTILYTDLIENPEREILKIYEQLGLEAGDTFKAELHKAIEEHRNYASTHRYSLEDFGLTEDYIYNELKEIFDAHDLPRHPAPDVVI